MAHRVRSLAAHVASGVTASPPARSTPAAAPMEAPKPMPMPKPAARALRTCKDVASMSLDAIRDSYGRDRADGVRMSGVNHVACGTSDMARTVWFWCEVLGMKLDKTLELPGNGQHFFIEAGPSCCIAYFYFPRAPPRTPGVASVDMDKVMSGEGFATAHGSVNHVAFNVPQDKLREYRSRVKEANVGYVSPILFHSDADPSGYSEKEDEHTCFISVRRPQRRREPRPARLMPRHPARQFYFLDPDGCYVEMTSQTTRPFVPETDVNHVPAPEGYGR